VLVDRKGEAGGNDGNEGKPSSLRLLDAEFFVSKRCSKVKKRISRGSAKERVLKLPHRKIRKGQKLVDKRTRRRE